MEKLAIFKFFIPVAILASVFSGTLYNLLIFLNKWALESHWSIILDDIAFANLMALSFVLFTIVFIITAKFVETLSKEPFIITGTIIIGFSCIFCGLIWLWELVILVFVITSATTAFLIPTIIKYTADKVEKNYKNANYVLILPLSTLIWLGITVMLFIAPNAPWRILYFVTGSINIFSSFLIALT